MVSAYLTFTILNNKYRLDLAFDNVKHHKTTSITINNKHIQINIFSTINSISQEYLDF